MNLFDYLSAHWWVGSWLVFWILVFAYSAIHSVFVLLPNRVLRHWNIRKHGYPPIHCDADGDFKKEEDN